MKNPGISRDPAGACSSPLLLLIHHVFYPTNNSVIFFLQKWSNMTKMVRLGQKLSKMAKMVKNDKNNQKWQKSKHLKACLGPASVTVLHRRGPPLTLCLSPFWTGGGPLGTPSVPVLDRRGPPWHSVR